MDRQQLLAYYSTHYLSRQEILFKLPFSISADSFWQELVNRRKAKATILPLYNAAGKPYWYCMTDKMVAASETLCEEAIRQDEFDPYRMEMTTAMTWEMFFTSFLEGASLDMDEALDYLSWDEEPSGVQEQLLWNNRQAMCTMVRGIFRPLDEGVLLQLACLLTQDMDTVSEGYRQEDSHLVAAMGDENYEVPAARDIPARMQDLYAYLAKPDIHPLIKSAVGQAYLLAIRPFPDGNERLSRMLSAQILYRSGYDYFRDISLSRKLAQESYRYYKNMRELLRPDSDGDMTCFVEYFIDLLARALQDAKAEAARQAERKETELLTQERQLAGTPLQPQSTQSEEPTPTEIGELLAGAEPMELPSEENVDAEKETSAAVNAAIAVPTNTEFWSMIERLCFSPFTGSKHIGQTIKQMLEQGVTHFTVEQWAIYNPFSYIHSEKDILKLVNTLIANTKGDGKGGDDFWQKAEVLLYTALIGYIHYEVPEEEQNFAMLIEFINAMEVREDDEDFKNNVDLLFDDLEKKKPNHFALRQYKKYKLAAGKTAKSINISCGARLAPFDIQELRDITMYDELELDTLGDKIFTEKSKDENDYQKTALFLIMSDTDPTFNFLISMIYTQLFNLLCEKADDVYGGRLPIHVRCLIDECANIGQIPNLEKLVATIRSREISACLVLQAQSQLKAIYKDNADTIVGNMDSRIFLGGSEPTTIKELNAALGKETIDTFNTSDTRGNSPSKGLSYQKLGHELMSQDEIAVMDGGKCILQLRGVRPFFSDKYDITKHPNYKYLSDADPRNAFKIEKFLSTKLKVKEDDEYDFFEIDVSEEDYEDNFDAIPPFVPSP